MIKRNFIIFFFFLLTPYFVLAATDRLDLRLNVLGTCNNNSICEPSLGEDVLSCPVDCAIIVPPGSSSSVSSGSIIPDNFIDLIVSVDYSSAVIKWKTISPVISVVSWGKNPDYKDGVLKNINFKKEHQVEINNLKDGTIYYFNIEITNFWGQKKTLENQFFKTLSLPDVTPPGNPTNFKALPFDSRINLYWNNPNDFDFDYVRVMRQVNNYSGDPYQGHLAYEGRGEYFTDSNNLILNTKYFYSIFSRDKSGNYSSGSLASVFYGHKKNTDEKIIEEISERERLDYTFFVSENGEILDFPFNSILDLDGDKKISIKIKYKDEVRYENIWVEIKNEIGDTTGLYLFGKKKDGEGFINALLPIFPEAGLYKIAIYRFSYNNITKLTEGSFQVRKNISITEEKDSTGIFYSFLFISFLILFFFILWLLLVRIFKRKEKN